MVTCENQSSQIFQRYKSRLKSLGWRQAKFHTEGQNMLGATEQFFFSPGLPGTQDVCAPSGNVGIGWESVCEVLWARRWTLGLISKFIFRVTYLHIPEKDMYLTSYFSLWERYFCTNECKLKKKNSYVGSLVGFYRLASIWHLLPKLSDVGQHGNRTRREGEKGKSMTRGRLYCIWGAALVAALR